MKASTLTSKKFWLPAAAIVLTIGLVSWDYQQTPNTRNYQQEFSPTDTTPKKKKTPVKKVQDLDDVLHELEAVDIDNELQQAQVEINKALKEIDGEKIRSDVEKAMKEVDFSSIQKNIQEAMKSVDFSSIQKEINESLKDIDFEKIQKDVQASIAGIDFKELQKTVQQSIAAIDFDKIKVEVAEAQKIDMSAVSESIRKAQEEMKEIKPRLEKELGNAKIEIEKVKVQMREYKTFVDGLDKDGLINKKDSYSIKNADGDLLINGKKASNQTISKYKDFLDKHPRFSIEKTDDDFDIDMD